jgi:hypothetical protein
VKGAEAELATLRMNFKARGLSEVAGDDFTFAASEQIKPPSRIRTSGLLSWQRAIRDRP